MTDDEVNILLLEFIASKGGVVTEADIDRMAETLEQHFPYPEQTSLNQARTVLGLPITTEGAEGR